MFPIILLITILRMIRHYFGRLLSDPIMGRGRDSAS